MSGAVPVRRDRNWVEREYNREKYPLILKGVRETLESGERDLSRIIGRVCGHERGDMGVAMHREVVIDGEIVRTPLLFSATGISGFIIEAMAESCAPGTDTVIELGAGWGRNLFLLHLSGRIAAKTALYALEFAETARLAGTLIANAVPSVRFKAQRFDYHAPDYSMIPRSKAPALVATIHSAEQIPQMKPEVLTQLIERRPVLTGLHLEPVSFQMPADRRGLRPAKTSGRYAETHDYNRNLWPLLASLETEGVIEILDVVPDVLGLNPHNASTLITWRTKKALDA